MRGSTTLAMLPSGTSGMTGGVRSPLSGVVAGVLTIGGGGPAGAVWVVVALGGSTMMSTLPCCVTHAGVGLPPDGEATTTDTPSVVFEHGAEAAAALPAPRRHTPSEVP